MFKSISKGMKKLIPGQSNTQDRATQTISPRNASQTQPNNKSNQPSLPDSYWDAGLFK